jgi:hypothetical protein
MEDSERPLTQEQAFNKAHDILDIMQNNSTDDGKTKSHGLLLAYDPEREAFQMVAINSDAEEVTALVLSCLATLRETLKEIEDRTIN